MNDETKTRLNIDELFAQCGFILQDKSEFNRLPKHKVRKFQVLPCVSL